MPIEDARLISGVVEKLLSERSVISVSDVLQELSNRIPVYKVNLTLGGLVKVGAVIAHGRGSYILNSEHEGGSNDWMCEIEHYPKRSDLLDEISNSNKMR